jgi:hypothetical protein
MALFTYLSVFNDEWKEGGIPAHQQFWCVKAPIMIVFYFGDVLLTALVHFKVITDRPAENGGTHWTAEAIKNGYYVLLVCTCMLVVSILMQVYFGVNDKEYLVDEAEHNYFEAFTDSFLAYIPQFLKSLFYCGGDTVTLAKKRIKLKKDRRLSDDEHNLLTPNNDDDDFGSSQSFFRYSMRSDFDHKLRDDDDHRSSGHFNFNALPLEPLSISNINYRDHISMPPPPRTDRTLRRKDESTQELTTRNSHFTPHD